LALRETAHEIEHRVLRDESHPVPEMSDRDLSKRHKILLLVTADPKTAMLIRRARRVSDYLGAECFAVAVNASDDLGSMPDKNREAIEAHLSFARNMLIETRILQGSDEAQVLVDFARRNQITQIFVARPRERRYMPQWHGGLPQRIVRLAKDMQVIIVSEREPEPD